MKKRQFQISRIHASSAVREQKRHVRLLTDAAAASVIVNDLKAAASTRDNARTLGMASKGLERASRSINLENVLAHANNFLARSEDFKIASSAIQDVSDGVQMQQEGPEGQGDVDKMMEELADDAGVDMRMNLEQESVPKQEVGVAATKQNDTEIEGALGARLKALRN
jgi:charged multivesicular body protein 1